MTEVLLTIDTELLWRPEVTREGWQAALARSFDPAGVGVPYQLAKLTEHRLNAVFFVDPMPALHFGMEPLKHIIAPILDAGQGVQLHLHPQWASLHEGVPTRSFELNDYSEGEQRDLIAQGCALLIEAGAPPPIAFRAGSFAANDATLRAAASLGLRYDSSHNGSAHPWPSAISLSSDQIVPIAHEGIIELPVTLISDLSGFRHLQICAVSLAEMQAALRYAVSYKHPIVTIVSHSFELAARNGQRPNRAHLRRFDGLCAFLDENRDYLPTRRILDLAPPELGITAEPLPNAPLRMLARQAEQLWSNLYEERSS